MRQAGIILILSFITGGLWAQDTTALWSPSKILKIYPGQDSVLIDSLPVIKESILLLSRDKEQAPPKFRISEGNYTYILLDSAFNDTLLLKYKVIPLPLNQEFYHKDTSLIIPEITAMPPILYSPQNTDFKPFRGLDSKGSISRGISIGSNQDAVLSSNLNLQLSGEIGNNTILRASISDNNLPVQSDGYTQELREFDRVYMELENPHFGMLRAGDYNMTSTQNYFLKFDKRISGAGIFSAVNLDKGQVPVILQAGIARGKFARNRFQGQEGNQGPYKLRGANGEQFIIIISGSERVYIDGILQIRGQQNDYIMDYNAGEIIFTALQPITKESRIVVEFQYTEQNYLRSVAFGSSGFNSERVKLNVQFYSEQDSKNQSLRQALSDDEKRVLSRAGDAIEDARVSSIFPSAFRNDIVLYELKDSLGYDSILVFSTDSNRELYQANFTFVGNNKGNYLLTPNTANGRVFKWIPPVNNIPQGNYEPIKQLVAPNKLQILSFETEALLTANQKLNVDMAISNYDLNLFSEDDKSDDIGSAGKFQYNIKGKLKELDWFSQVRYEYNQENFRTIERIRTVEFARDWNLPLNYDGAVQLSGVNFGLQQANSRAIYQLEYLNLNGYQALKNSLAGRLKTSENIGFLDLSWLQSSDSLGNTSFLREKGEFRHFLKPGFWVGLGSVGEINRRNLSRADSLLNSSYSFLEYRVFTGIGDTNTGYAEVFYMQRRDDTARTGNLRNFSLVNAYGLKSKWQTNFNSRLEVFANIRNLKVYFPEERDLETTITSRFNYVQRFFGNAISSTTFYESGSGTEARRIFSYVEVPAGTGTYTHTDYNNNGIKELDEFEVSPTPDLATYVRVFTPSSEYLRSSVNKFGQTININPPHNWKQADDLRKLLSRFSFLINYQLDRKTLLTGGRNNLNPFKEIENDTLIVALNEISRNTVFFNRTSSLFGMDYTYSISDNHNLLSFGIEQRSVIENEINLRYNIMEPLIFRTKLAFIEKQNRSQNFTRRNFSISNTESQNSLAYQPNNKIQFTAKYGLSYQSAQGDEEVNLYQQDFGAEVNYNVSEKFAAMVQLNYIKNDFEGNSNNPAAFEMLRGLKPGKNVTWMLNVQRNLRKNILVSLNYNGRLSQTNSPVHIGSLQVKAFF